MTRRQWIARTACVLALLLCGRVCAQATERPVLQEGDVWVFNLHQGGNLASAGNYEFIESYNVRRVLPPQWNVSTGYELSWSRSEARTGETRKNNYRISRDLNTYARQNPASPQYEARWLQWPLESGRSWRFERPIAAGMQVWEAKVQGWEDIEVPAGKFRTMRVDVHLISNPNPLLTWQVSIWYSPEAKWFVKKTEFGVMEASVPIRRDTYELTSYQLR
jgi:hypothetical protein